MSTETNWPTPGCEAVILQPWERGSLQATTVVVERVLKRDVVLSNGDRFNAERLTKNIGGTWGMTLYLVPPSDPRVAETRLRIQARRLRSRAINAFEDWRIGKVDPAVVSAAFADLATSTAEGAEG